MKRGWAIAVLVALLLAGGCASVGMSRQFASEAEAVATLGEPARRWSNADGTTTLEYPTQPYGDTTLMLTVDAAGAVLGRHDALSDENLARVAVGMTREEVSRLLGRHRSVQVFSLSGEEVWDWNVRNDWPGAIATLFNVHFVDGRVVRTSRSYVYPREMPSRFFIDPASVGGELPPLRARVPYRWYHGWPYRAAYGW